MLTIASSKEWMQQLGVKMAMCPAGSSQNAGSPA
jgi:hypothetical protein